VSTATGDIANLYDHEVEQILAAQLALNERARAKKHNYIDFEAEIRGRFAEIGFTVDISWYTFSDGGAPQEGAMPEITITGRTEKRLWDPDRQVHEAVHDVLGLGESGWIKSDPDTLKNFRNGQGGHGHGHGHSHH
jgi:hypothetical protein